MRSWCHPSHHGQVEGGLPRVLTAFSFFPSLKRTTDMMFGGKQVVVCGYGEVRALRSASCGIGGAFCTASPRGAFLSPAAAADFRPAGNGPVLAKLKVFFPWCPVLGIKHTTSES